ncbi:hypothetical protein P8A18_15970 [Streptomyces castrisilvae]|uniref:Uncharacterized protein n=1 Tax=Streptomyces castrisilvae TaxID=3033811 RepID=A0ABY9HK19_9ACTN|nr:hypothetical protein [Streptomyces sp. Mut1]WLQ34840.1 hypothetical protein P8A18_15970 [Streptomyces sp. Mut1]
MKATESNPHRLLAAEVLYLTARLEEAYEAQYMGDETFLTRQRIARLEGLLAALQGFPEVMNS